VAAEPLAIGLSVNGRRHEIEVAVHHTLLDVLRDEIGLTGTKECCAEGECGACTVLVDGTPVNSCLVLGVEADGVEVTTVEGLGNEHGLGRVQEAFLAAGGVQCGFCIPGMVMSAQAFLVGRSTATRAEIREALSGNLCRCGGYNQICEAVELAASAGVER
jgi:aerobic carbon-monoxide dehydrogenase small subunit